MIVEVETVARLCSFNGIAQLETLRMPLTMRYTAQDPYAVQFVFGPIPQDPETVTWLFGRDLLADGLHRRDPDTGPGDVALWRALGPVVLWLRLSNDIQTALYALDRREVARFVRRSYALVGQGRESEHMDVDRCVERLLEARP